MGKQICEVSATSELWKKFMFQICFVTSKSLYVFDISYQRLYSQQVTNFNMLQKSNSVSVTKKVIKYKNYNM